jgi:hypothetical protein
MLLWQGFCLSAVGIPASKLKWKKSLGEVSIRRQV